MTRRAVAGGERGGAYLLDVVLPCAAVLARPPLLHTTSCRARSVSLGVEACTPGVPGARPATYRSSTCTASETLSPLRSARSLRSVASRVQCARGAAGR